MGGAKKKSEPASIDKLLALGNIASLFQKVGWLEFMKKFEGYTEQLVKEFAEIFIDEQTVVHGKCFRVSPKIISRLSSLENRGINFTKTTNITYQIMV